MFPIPIATKNLLLACVALACLDQLLPRGWLQTWFAFWPIGSGRFMPWQLLSYALLHGSVTHLLLNMLGLWMFGSELEKLWGPRRYLQFLAVAAITGAGAQMVVTAVMGSTHAMVGASGAVYGLLLAYAMSFPEREFELVGSLPILLIALPSPTLQMLGFVLFVVMSTNRRMIPIPPVYVRALVMVSIFGAIELFLGLFVHTGIAHFAHLGGMLGGWLMMAFWRGNWRSGRR